MNKNLSLYFILAFTIFSLVSCDVWHRVQGTVVDYETNQPISGVLVSIGDNSDFIYDKKSVITDSTGSFSLLNKRNQAFKTNKHICTQVRFIQENYKPLDLKICANKKDSIIYLERK